MDTSAIIWIVVAVLVVLAVAAIAAALMRRKRTEQQREEAERLRYEARSRVDAVADSRVEAQEAQARAERAALEAERARADATRAQEGVQVEQARVEDQVRTADRIDPSVDHSADDYHPELPDQSGTTGAGSESTSGPTDDRWRTTEK